MKRLSEPQIVALVAAKHQRLYWTAGTGRYFRKTGYDERIVRAWTVESLLQQGLVTEFRPVQFGVSPVPITDKGLAALEDG
jgi:hypothetical protein